MNLLAKNLEVTLTRAIKLTEEYNHEYSTTEHLLLALLDDPEARNALICCACDIPRLYNDLKEFALENFQPHCGDGKISVKPTIAFRRVIQRAGIFVNAEGLKEIDGANVLAEIFSEHESFAAFYLLEQNIKRVDIVNYILHGITRTKHTVVRPNIIPTSMKIKDNKLFQSPHIDAIAAESQKEGSPLTNYCINLNQAAKNHSLDILIGREDEVERTIEVLSRRNKNNPLYVGEPGVGKTAIVEGLALKIVRKEVPEIMSAMTIYSLDMGSLVAGTRYRGDFEERIKSVIREVESTPYAVLFIDEIHSIIGAGSTSGSSLDASNLLKPALARGSFRCIGATTFKEYRGHFEKDQALVRRFQLINVEEPSSEQTVKILNGLRKFYEKHHNVTYTKGAVSAAVLLSERYMPNRHLPDKAIDLLDEAGSHVKLKNSATKVKKIVSAKDVEAIVSKITHIPIKALTADDAERILHLDGELKKTIYGQDKAISEVVSAMKFSYAGLRNQQRPIGCYMFYGPTGVGKTELAKQLAKLINMEFIRFDMSEYVEQHSISRLIGAPPGYVGFEQGSLLTDAVYKNSYSVVLFDEIEKAHKDIYNILLQIMDYGRITDSNGRFINFCNCIVILTTNAGAFEMSKSAVGFERAARSGEDTEEIKKLFTPEFLNRLDAQIHFAPLDFGTVIQVVSKYISQLAVQLKERDVALDVSQAAKEFIATTGYDPHNGARPLERFITKTVKQSLVDEILFGKLTKGGYVSIDFKDGQLQFDIHGKGEIH